MKNSLIRKVINEKAQDSLMFWIVTGIENESENAEDETVIKEMRKQAIAIAKRFGYSSWPGLF